MPFNGSGVFTPASPQYPAISGAVIYADDWNTIVADIAAGLSIAMTTDGQATPTANLTMGNKRLISMANGVGAQDATTVAQVFTGGTFNSATLVGAVTSADPAATDSSLKLISSAWVNSRLALEIDYGFDPASTNYGRDLVTSKWVKDQVLVPVYIAAIAVYAFQNL